MAVGRTLKALRDRNQLSMNKVHLQTRMSTSYLAKLERDEFVPGEDNLRRIVMALKELEVPDAEMLYEEHRAVEREREALGRLQEHLAEIEDPGERLRLLDDFVQTVGSRN
jgi:transcriptional regulator with XRE-family HTH domain